MADVKCPMCGKPNPDDLDTCQFCDARLKPLIHPSPDDRAPLRPGDAPTKKDTAEFEGAGYRERLAGQGPIAPGDVPTKKDTSELERALPAWLRQARNPDRPLDLDSGEAKPDEGPAPASEGGPASSSGLPDWLADLAAGKESKVDTGELLSGLASEDESEVPGWLTDLRGEDDTSAFGAAPEPEDSLAHAESDDWLSRLSGESAQGEAPRSDWFESPADQPQPKDEEKEGPIDWLDQLKPETGKEEGPAPEPGLPSQAGGPEEEIPVEEAAPDWLKDLQAETPEAAPAEEGELPSWISGLAGEEAPVSPEPAEEAPSAPAFEAEIPAEEGELPSWISGLAGEEAPVPPEPAEEAAPDWLKDLQAETPEAAPAEEGELPSWLSGLAGEEAPVSPEPAEEIPPAPAFDAETPAEEGELPSWLSGLVDEASLEEAPSTPQPEAGLPAEEGRPDWLSSLQAEVGSAEEVKPPVEEQPSPLEDMPDWFETLRAESAAQEPAPEKDELPPWLGGLESAVPSEELPAVPAFETDVPPAAETPDWLSSLKFEAPEDLAPEGGPPAQETGKPAPKSTPAFNTGSLGDLSEERTPDWLTNLQSPETPELGQPAEVREEAGEELPPWLGSLEAESAAAEEASPSPFTPEEGEEVESLPPWLSQAAAETEESPALGAADVFAAGVPDWLASVRPADEERPAEAAVPAGEDLRPADLPNWVQAMRPVEDAIAEAASALESERTEMEQHGPLAGIAGILPAGMLPTGVSRSSASRLQVTNTQQVNVGILEAVLGAESRPREVKRVRAVSSLRVLRWLVTAVLVLTVGLSAGLGSASTPTFSIPPEALLTVRNWVDGADLSAAPVLLVFDYEAALSSELEAAAAPVLDHLAIHGAKLATVSTSPTGPALADRQMRTLQATHTYQAGQNYVNLGYLPGGPAGILAFAQRPASAGGEAAWETPVLADTRELREFAGIFVITDSVETGQQWVEQTTGTRGPAQLFLIVSAQAEPMLYPYYQSGQVNGMVSGLAGGASYEANLNRPGPARRYWDAFSLGLLVSAMLIVLGTGWSLVSAWVSRPDKDEAK
ncbi:MAG: hypothetical protein AB1846_09740 [Chloroflexota bacterium]